MEQRTRLTPTSSLDSDSNGGFYLLFTLLLSLFCRNLGLVIPFLDSNLSTQFPPPLLLLLPSLPSQLQPRRPELLMDILDRPTPSPILLDEHIRLEMPFFDAVRIKLQFLPGDRVYKRVDHLVEGVEEEGNVDDERPSETLGVMVLEDIQDLNKRTAHGSTSARINGGGGN